MTNHTKLSDNKSKNYLKLWLHSYQDRFWDPRLSWFLKALHWLQHRGNFSMLLLYVCCAGNFNRQDQWKGHVRSVCSITWHCLILTIWLPTLCKISCANTFLLNRPYDGRVLVVKRSWSMKVTCYFVKLYWYCCVFDVSMLWMYIIVNCYHGWIRPGPGLVAWLQPGRLVRGSDG